MNTTELTDSPAQLPRIELRCIRLLMAWAIASVVLGIAGIVPFWGVEPLLPWQAFAVTVAIHFVIWGAIDLGFALPGYLGAKKRLANPPGEDAEAEQARKLMGALRFNGYLNILWVAIGVALLLPAPFWGDPTEAASWLGNGVGMLIQGGFLFVFDIHFSRRLREDPFLLAHAGDIQHPIGLANRTPNVAGGI